MYHGTEQIEEDILLGKQSTSIPFGGIRAGDFTVTAAVVDSLEYLALKELAPWHGSASLDVKVRKITVDISAVPGTPVTRIKFDAVSPEQAWIPADTDYRWDFGDGNTETVAGSALIYHPYTQEGTYRAKLELSARERPDRPDKVIIASDTLTVKVGSAVNPVSNLALLQKTKSVFVLVKGYTVRHHGSRDQAGRYTEIDTWPDCWAFGNAAGVITWNGRDFTASGLLGSQSWTISGRVSSDGNAVDSLAYEERYQNLNYNGGTWIRYTIVVIENLPFESIASDLFQFSKQGSDIGQYVTDFEYTEEISTGASASSYYYYTPFEWQNTSKGVPELTVEFR